MLFNFILRPLEDVQPWGSDPPTLHWFGLTDRVRPASDVTQGAFSAPSGNLSVEGLFLQFTLAY